MSMLAHAGWKVVTHTHAPRGDDYLKRDTPWGNDFSALHNDCVII